MPTTKHTAKHHSIARGALPPFGMLARSYSDSVYRFGFNTQERVSEIDKNHYTALFWEYDSRLARRWNLDPKPQIFISDYAVLGNSPLFYTDVLGDTIKGDIKSYNTYKRRVQSEINYYSQKIEKLSSKIAQRTEEGKSVSGLNKRLKAAQSMKSTFEGVMSELTEVENSTQIYFINTSFQGSGGNLSFDASTGYITVNVSQSMDLIEGLSHELKHAYQFETGKISLTSTGFGGYLYDLQDEVEAYKRSQLFGFYPSQTINANWVLNRGYGSLRKRTVQRTMSTPSLDFPGAPTLGLQIKSIIYKSGQTGQTPAQIIKDWQIYYQMGQTGQPFKP